jgi:hypothetical protein
MDRGISRSLTYSLSQKLTTTKAGTRFSKRVPHPNRSRLVYDVKLQAPPLRTDHQSLRILANTSGSTSSSCSSGFFTPETRSPLKILGNVFDLVSLPGTVGRGNVYSSKISGEEGDYNPGPVDDKIDVNCNLQDRI